MTKPMLKKGDQVLLTGCSDGIPIHRKERIDAVVKILESLDLRVSLSSTIFQKIGPFNGLPSERASELMAAFVDENIKAIFDITGGNAANQVLEYLDYGTIKANKKPFFGLSDLTVVLNSLYHCSDLSSYHFGLKTLVDSDATNQLERFKRLIFEGELEDFEYHFINGGEMSGTIIGGNLRCFLKLAGTRYMPDPKGKILLLEGLGGGPAAIATLLTQLKYLGFFNQINGLILGTFSELDRKNLSPNILEIMDMVLDNKALPIIKTNQIGHKDDARCIVIGEHRTFKK